MQNNSALKDTLTRAVSNLEADLAFAEDALNDPMVAKSYVVLLDSDINSMLRVDIAGRGNFTGTLISARVFTLAGAKDAVDAVKANPGNSEYLKQASIDYMLLTEACEIAKGKLPGLIKTAKETLAKI
ncbi:hypothetical protein Ares1_0089 [Vibrio phage Ares1]|nr:hypothetical protein Ares1_0089 [Vibrio phage Ares1]